MVLFLPNFAYYIPNRVNNLSKTKKLYKTSVLYLHISNMSCTLI